MKNARFPGRGYAAFTLGVVLASLGKRPAAALEALEACESASDPYVVALSESGRNVVAGADRGKWTPPWKDKTKDEGK